MRRSFIAFAFVSLVAVGPLAVSQASAQTSGWRPYGQMNVGMDDARDIAFDQGLVQAEQVFNDGYRWSVRGRDVNGRWMAMTIDGANGAVLWMQRN